MREGESLTFEQRAANGLVIAAILFNLVLCFVHTNLFPVTNTITAAVEFSILGAAILLVLRRADEGVILLGMFSCYLLFLAAVRFSFDPKPFRDIAIPLVFCSLGMSFGTYRSADRLINTLLVVVSAFALLEWFFLDTYLRFFDIQSFYTARGAIDATNADGNPGLFTSGLRFEGRTLLPFLGEHRVSSVFLEPVSLGNFAAICFAWILLRDRRNFRMFLLKGFVILVLLILGDARFGLYLCAALVVVFFSAPLIRPLMLFVLPFLVMLCLLFYAMSQPEITWDNSSVGRLLLGGQLLMQLDLPQFFGIGASGADFVDSGYAYALSQIGLAGCTALWALFIFGLRMDGDEWKFKVAAACYLVLLLGISTSFATIKTAALLWFLIGTAAHESRLRSPARGTVSSDAGGEPLGGALKRA